MTTLKKKTATEKIIMVLKNRKRGLTADQIAEKSGCPANTVRTALWSLRKDGAIQVVGALRTSGTGRPALLYTL